MSVDRRMVLGGDLYSWTISFVDKPGLHGRKRVPIDLKNKRSFFMFTSRSRLPWLFARRRLRLRPGLVGMVSSDDIPMPSTWLCLPLMCVQSQGSSGDVDGTVVI